MRRDRLPGWNGQYEKCRSIFVRTGPLLCKTNESREPETGKFVKSEGRFGASPCTGHRQWNSRIESSHALTAAPSSCLRPANKFSSTTNSSKTTPSIVNSARRNERVDRRECAPRRGPPARLAALKPLFPLSRRRAVQCCAGLAFRNRGNHNWSWIPA